MRQKFGSSVVSHVIVSDMFIRNHLMFLGFSSKLLAAGCTCVGLGSMKKTQRFPKLLDTKLSVSPHTNPLNHAPQLDTSSGSFSKPVPKKIASWEARRRLF